MKLKKSRLWLGVMICSGLLAFGVMQPTARSAGVTLTGGTQRQSQGSTYWQTSNIREWLNSDAGAGKVQYTQVAPKSKADAGFLNQFSASEKAGLAVVKHQAVISYRDSGGGAYSGSINYSSGAMVNGPTLAFAYADTVGDYGNWEHQNVNDKVWIPTLDELYRLVESRGMSLTKDLTAAALSKSQLGSASQSYWMDMPDIGMASTETNRLISPDVNNLIYGSQATGDAGVAPMIALKPDTVVGGVKASSLKIGATVTYGTYLNSPIKWTVINMTNGYPQLFSQQSLDYKQYDNAGDYSQATSDYINFSTADVDFSTLKPAAPDGSSNVTLPVIKIADDSALYGRQNNLYKLHFTVTTTGAAFDHVLLPDGSTTTSSSFDYTFSQNENYRFMAYDKAGNVQTMVLPVSNINPPSSVMITPSTTSWSNKPVTVDIKANNNVGIANPTTWSMMSTRDLGMYSFPNYTTYSGKQLHLKYTLTGGTPTASLRVGNPVLPMLAYRALRYTNGQYTVTNRWVTGDIDKTTSWAPTPYSSIMNGNSKSVDVTFAVPADYNSAMSLQMHMEIQYDEYFYPYKVSNATLQLVDNDDFGIKSITLPSGQVVNSSSYTDTLANNGTYTYKVLDSRGQVTSSTVTVKIDTTNPALTVSGVPSAVTNKDVTLHEAATDAGGSGVSQVQSPLGDWRNGSSLDYTVSQEGSHTYSFGVKDGAGNVTTKTVTVDLDKTAPSLTVTGNPTAITHKPVTLSATSTDDHSGIKRVQTPDGIWHNGSSATYTAASNGDYTFVTEDNAGNQTSKKVTVSQIGSSDYVSHDDSGSLVQSTSQAFGSVTLSGAAKAQDVSAKPLQFGDTQGNTWKLLVAASPFTSGGHTLPAGSLELGNLSYSGPDQKLTKLLSVLSAIDKNQDVPVLQSTAGNTGEYELDLNGSQFAVHVPANAYVGNYQTQISWKLQH